MAKYVCAVCGYVFDEEKGNPEAGIAAGTLWKDVPENFVCPLCGATKSEFKLQADTANAEVKKKVTKTEVEHNMQALSALESSALCTNLARGCEKQYKTRESELFRELADYFKSNAPAMSEPANIENLIGLINKDLEEGFVQANETASEKADRGALRALVWSEKVTRILKSLLSRYQSDGDNMFMNTGVYVCTICGFVYVGDALPELCPVCKVPNWKFEKIEGGA